jgi:hypothetical protein
MGKVAELAYALGMELLGLIHGQELRTEGDAIHPYG